LRPHFVLYTKHNLIFKTQAKHFFVDENYFAIENVCPHAYALLTEGFIEDQTVECPFNFDGFRLIFANVTLLTN
jgi:nitrite reductase/ring-hydroxylating ferredoxin subunit